MSIGLKVLEDNVVEKHAVPTADAETNTYMRDVVGIKTDAAVTTVGTVATIIAYIKGLLNELAKVPKSDKTITIVQDSVMGTGTPDIVVATSSASANTFGSWAAVDASAAADCWVSHIFVTVAPSAGNYNWCVELGTGASPTAKIRLSGQHEYISSAGTFSSNIFPITFPIKIASGTAISVRVSDSVASALEYNIGVSFYNGL